ncbi:MAG: PD40 domain-containing protein [Acidobacteria bacterium]|nr:PD40 domain-containing protein [Acidobacteriota bacterium]
MITRAVYRSDGGGYIDNNHPNHLWVISAPKSPEEKPQPKQLTSGAYSEGGFVWSRDGAQIYYTTNRTFEPYYNDIPTTEIYSVPSAGGTPTLLTKVNMGVGGLSLESGREEVRLRRVSVAKPVLSYTQPDLWVMDVAQNAQPKNLTTGFDFDIGGGVGGDNAPPRAGGGGGVIWTADGKSIIIRYAKEGRANLGMFDATTGKMSEVTKGDQAILAYQPTRDASKIVYTRSTPTVITDLYVLDRASGSSKQLTKGQ